MPGKTSPGLNMLRPRLSPTVHRSALLSSDRWVCHYHLCGRWLAGERKGLSIALMKELDFLSTHPAVTASRRLTHIPGQPYQGLTYVGFLPGLLKVSISLRTCPMDLGDQDSLIIEPPEGTKWRPWITQGITLCCWLITKDLFISFNNEMTAENSHGIILTPEDNSGHSVLEAELWAGRTTAKPTWHLALLTFTHQLSGSYESQQSPFTYRGGGWATGAGCDGRWPHRRCWEPQGSARSSKTPGT